MFTLLKNLSFYKDSIPLHLAIRIGHFNEVIVYRVMMYANPLLIVQAMYSTFKGQSVYYSTWR